jgi:hypothetical protein
MELGHKGWSLLFMEEACLDGTVLVGVIDCGFVV